jgi:hypothetical protein
VTNLTLNELATKLDNIAVIIPYLANQLKRDVVQAILDDLIQVTPVDTGKAVSNWQVQNEPFPSIVEAYVPSPKGRMLRGVWTHLIDPEVTRGANAEVAAEVARVTLQITEPGIPLYIVNGLPYIARLNAGTSSQAPAGFTDRAIVVGKSLIDSRRFLP